MPVISKRKPSSSCNTSKFPWVKASGVEGWEFAKVFKLAT